MKENFITRYGKWIIKWRWFAMLFSIVLVLLCVRGAKNLGFDNDYHAFFNEDNPKVLAFDELQEKYTKDDNIFIMIEPESGEVFNRNTLQAIEDLEKLCWQVPYSMRVDAISNFQHTSSQGDDLSVANLASDISSKSEAEIIEIKKIALSEPLLVNRMIDETGTITGLNINLNLPTGDMQAAPEAAIYANEMVTKWEKEHPGFNTYLSGQVMRTQAFGDASQGDMKNLIPLMLLTIVITLLLWLRSPSTTITGFLVLIFSIMTAMGIAGWLGIKITPPSSIAPTMILTLAIADGIHIMATVLYNMRKGMAKREAIINSISLNFMPVLITTVTTVVGFLSLNSSEGTPFKDLGNITAIGVAAAFIYSVIFLPAFLSIMPLKVKQKVIKEPKPRLLDKLAVFVTAKPKKVLLVSSALTLIIISFAFKLELNNQFLKFFGEDVKFRTDTEQIAAKLTGVQSIEYSLNSGEPDGITSPEYLTHLNSFEEWYKQQPEVEHVSSFAEVMRKLNKSMHGDSISYYRIPTNKQEAAQYLLLYELSLPLGLDLNNQINVDKSETRFTVTVKDLTTKDILALSDRAEKWLVDNTPEYMNAHSVSPDIMFSNIATVNSINMLRSGFAALVIISFLLMFALRSFKYGLITLLPNLLPVLIAFGIWGVFVGQINMATATVLGMTLGIVTDDSIHMMSKYLYARKTLKLSAEEAIHYVFSTVGRAIIATTAVLLAGFTVLMQSSFELNNGMSKITAITMVVALIVDLIMLPALLVLVDKKNKI